MTLDEAAKLFHGLALKAPDARKEALEKAAVLIETEAKRVIGIYDPNYGWPHLALATEISRVRKGYTPDDPLLRARPVRR